MTNHFSRRQFLLSPVCLLLPVQLLGGEQEATLSVDVKVVNLLATVRNKQGRIIPDLSREDFSLEVDGRPKQIRYFGREMDLPLILGLLVDTSLSQRNVLGLERTASDQFLNQVLRANKDKAFLIHFDREVELLQDLTSSQRQLESGLRYLETPQPSHGRGPNSPSHVPKHYGRGGGTLLYDAVFLASNDIMKSKPGRKALVLLSDGVDTGSKVTLETAVESAQRADTLIYSILFADEQAYAHGGNLAGPHGVGMGGTGRHGSGYPRFPRQPLPDGKKVLERLSKETGASFFQVSKKQSIEQIYDQIEEELRNQYSLGYSPVRAELESGFHKIRLTTRQKDLVVQTRDGYHGGL